MPNRWWLDDVNLDRYAFNIQNRSAGWAIAPRRGENYRVPGRDGTLWNGDKPFDEATIVMTMLAAGANIDGEFPGQVDEDAKVREHLDTLSRLFGKGGLRELVRADAGDYNRVNEIPNPSMENAGERVLVRENIINNPSGEYSEDRIVVRRNFADNPGMERASAERAYRTNLVRNPRMAGEAEPMIAWRNWVKNPSLEAGLRFWRKSGNSVIFASRQSRLGATWPAQGQRSLRMVAVADGNASCECTSIEVDPGATYTFSGYVWNRCEVNRTCRIFVRWFNKAGAPLAQSANVDTVVNIEETARLSTTVAAPANAATAAIRFVLVGAETDDVMYVDAAMATKTGTLLPYFDGDSDEDNGFRHRWRDAAGRSISIRYWVPARGWYTPNHRQMCTTEYAARGSQSAKLVIQQATTVGEVVFRQTAAQGCKVDEETWVCGSIAARLGSDDDGLVRNVTVNLQCWDSDGNFLGVVEDATGVAIPDEPLQLASGNWQRVEFEAGLTLPDTATVTLAVKCAEVWATDDVVYFDSGLVEPAKRLGDEWFDGGVPDDDVFTYIWTGDPHWSTSEQRGSGVVGWWARDGHQHQVAEGRMREFALLLEPFREPEATDRPQAEALALDTRPGRSHTLSAWVNLTRSHSVRLGVSYDDGETWTYGGAETPVVATWERLSFTFVVPEDADPETTWIAVASNAAPADGDQIKIDSVLFEPCSITREFFDGESGSTYEWADDPERSESRRLLARPNGWHGHGNAYPVVRRRKDDAATDGSYVVRSVANQSGNLGITFAQDGIDAELDYSFGVDVRCSEALIGYVAIVWLNEEGDQVGIDQSASAAFPTVAFARKTITASPPADATVAVPIIIAEGATADDWLDADKAVFGFGGDTTYADGNTAGWEWTGRKGFSESQKWGVGVDYWGAANGTLARNATWSTNRDHNATYTVTDSGPNCTIWAVRNNDNDERRYKIKTLDPITFAVDVRAVTTPIKARARLMLSRWKGQGWRPSTGTDPVSDMVDIPAGEERRVSITIEPGEYAAFIGDATHFRPAISVFDPAGNAPPTGQVVRLDSASLSRDLTEAYQDGTYEYVVWTGDPDASRSRRVGPARRIMVERTVAIDATAYGESVAEYAVQLTAPHVWWEDTIERTQRLALPRAGGVLLLDKFEGTTAPIHDATITVNGPINDFKITDVGTGAWLRMNLRLSDDQTIVIDNDSWIVRTARGKRRFDAMSHSGHGVLLPITPRSDETVPRLRIEADSIGRGARLTVAGRRKYMIA